MGRRERGPAKIQFLHSGTVVKRYPGKLSSLLIITFVPGKTTGMHHIRKDIRRISENKVR
jgi:hypothetical protein